MASRHSSRIPGGIAPLYDGGPGAVPDDAEPGTDYLYDRQPPATARGVNMSAAPPGGIQPPPVVMAVPASATAMDSVAELAHKLSLAIYMGNTDGAILAVSGLCAQWPRPLLTIRQTRDPSDMQLV